MATAGRLMARLMRSRGALPAASEACSSGRSRMRPPRLYRRSRRAGCAAYTRTVIVKAESTARPRPQPFEFLVEILYPFLDLGGQRFRSSAMASEVVLAFLVSRQTLG